MLLERSFLSGDGLPERPWFRHLLFAPGLTTGYGSWPFPELAEAVENKDPQLFAHASDRVVQVVEKATAKLDEARHSAPPLKAIENHPHRRSVAASSSQA